MATTELAKTTATASNARRLRAIIARPRRQRACQPARLLGYTLAALFAATTLGVALALAAPGLAGFTPPHPTLRPTAQAVASILQTNLRVLAAPFLLIAFRFHTTTAARTAGDLILAAILAANAVHVGLAIGRWHARLLPYLPHLPLEYTAAALAATAWLSARQHGVHHQRHDKRATTPYAAGTVALLLAAALVEVLLTPHAR